MSSSQRWEKLAEATVVTAAQDKISVAEDALRCGVERYQSEGPYTSLTDLERHRVWVRILRNQARRVIRARLAHLKRRIAAAQRRSARYAQLQQDRERLANGGEDTILISFGVCARRLGFGTRDERTQFIVATATCDICKGVRLAHFGKEHGVASDQLACSTCGGMFAVDDFLRC